MNIKTAYLRLYLLLTMLLNFVGANAFDFVVDGIYFSKLANTNNEVEVTYYGSWGNTYSGSITIPETVNYNNEIYSVTAIGSNAFSGCGDLKSVSLPISIKRIKENGFYSCRNLSSITIPQSVEFIGSRAFYGCWALQSFEFPSKIVSIEEGILTECKNLTTVILPYGVNSIGENAFQSCQNLNSIEIPSSVKSIGSSAFHGCVSLTSIVIPNSVSSLGGSSFSGCTSLTEVVLSSSIKTIPSSAFFNCNLLSISIPESVSSIGDRAFAFCSKLSSVEIPKNVSYIGDKILQECDNLQEIRSKIENPSNCKVLQFSFNWIPNSCILYVPKGTKSAYEESTNWVTYFRGRIIEDVSLFELTLSSSLHGEILYDGTIIRGETKTITINEGSSATITFNPDNGYQIKSVKVNSTDVTSSVSNNQYTVSNIKANTTVEVEFEAIPIPTYTLSVKATGNGSATYDNTTAKNNTKTFTLDEGTSATITITPDNGYRIKSVKVNSADVTSNVSNNQYTVSNIKANTTVEVEFEAIPIPTYNLSVKATGNGSATYDGTTAKNNTKTFTLDEGTSATITFTPDNGYRIKSVKVNSADVTSSISNNQYTVNNIKANTTVEVEFEAIPIPTYNLSVKATGNGSATYDGTTAKNNTKTFTLDEGTSATITFTPDNGYRIKCVKVNSMDVTSKVSNNQYTISSISINTTVEVDFEVIPKNSYTLMYIVDGVTYKTYHIEEGATITPEAKPTKEGYTFSGWSNIPTTMPAKDVTITGSFTVNKYRLTYQVDGKEYKSFNIEYGTTITPEAKPTKEGYTFSGWSEIPKTMPAKDVTVTGSFSINKYKLIYQVDGKEYKTYSIEYGATITPEAKPTKEGYTFSGWSDIPTTMPAKDVTITGSFAVNKYKLTYQVDGKEYKTYNIEYGATITPEAEPTKEGYTFSGWSIIPTTMPAKDVTVTGTFTQNKPDVKTYTLKYVIDGKTYKTYIVQEGAEITPEAKPTKEGYTFSGWSEIPTTMPAKDVTVAGSFSINKYKLIYQVDGKEYKTYSIEYGATITPEAEPTKEGYTFSGWSIIPTTMPAKDVTVTGTFTQNKPDVKTYTITYVVDGESYKTYQIQEGATIVPEAEPTKEGYTFSGWSEIPTTMPGKDVTITGTFTKNEIIIKNYTLTITATGNGNASYNGTETRNSTQTYTLNEGITAKVSFNPDNGYQIKSAKVNGREIADLSTMSFTIDIMDEDVTIEVEFEAIPINTYTIKYVVDGETYKSYQIEEGETITPEAEPTKEGYTFSGWSEIPSIMPANDVTIMGTFTKNEPEPTPIEMSFVIDGINYEVVSMDDHTVVVVSGNYGQILDVPAAITYGGIIWSIIGLKDGALDNCNELAAVIWNPSIAFNARVSNPNLLLYVKDEAYKSLGVKNVVVNGTAGSIELTDAANGNDFYCPRAFTAKKISYSHYYNMETGLGDSKGWETIVLPFDVQKYTSRKGEIEPFTKWTTTGSTKPFWLFELTASGYKDVEGIKANIPYIISMPNNPQYLADYVITGIVTFSAENVEVKASDDMQPVRYQNKTFVPNYINQNDENCFALNVNNYYITNSSTDKDGCKFIKGLRSIHPFEAYMTTTSNTRSIDVLDGLTTTIHEIMIASERTDIIKVYDTKGVLVKTTKANDNLRKGLTNGVYIVNGKKMIIK